MVQKKKAASKAKGLTVQEKKILGLYRKVQTEINTPPKPIVETLTPAEKEVLDAFRTGEYEPMHQVMFKHRREQERAFWRERLAGYKPLGSFAADEAEHDHETPTELELVAMQVAHHLAFEGLWIERRMLWGMAGNYSDLIREIAQAMLKGIQRIGGLGYLDRWVIYEADGLLDTPDAETETAEAGGHE